MRQQILAELRAERPARTWSRTWPAMRVNVDFIALGAAIGLIAAVVFGAPHLRLL